MYTIENRYGHLATSDLLYTNPEIDSSSMIAETKYK
jgi:hypothetical protein